MSENTAGAEVKEDSHRSSDDKKFQSAKKESQNRPRYTRLQQAAQLCMEVTTGHEDIPYTNFYKALFNFELALTLVNAVKYSSGDEPVAERMFHLYLLYNIARICLQCAEQQVENINNLKKNKNSISQKEESAYLKKLDSYLAQAVIKLNKINPHKNLLNGYELFNFYELWAKVSVAKGRLPSIKRAERDKWFILAQQNYIEALKIIPENSVARQKLADSARRELNSTGGLIDKFVELTTFGTNVLEDKKISAATLDKERTSPLVRADEIISLLTQAKEKLSNQPSEALLHYQSAVEILINLSESLGDEQEKLMQTALSQAVQTIEIHLDNYITQCEVFCTQTFVDPIAGNVDLQKNLKELSEFSAVLTALKKYDNSSKTNTVFDKYIEGIISKLRGIFFRYNGGDFASHYQIAYTSLNEAAKKNAHSSVLLHLAEVGLVLEKYDEVLANCSKNIVKLEDKKKSTTNSTASAFKIVVDKANLMKKYNNTLDFLLKGLDTLAAQEKILTNCQEKINNYAVNADDIIHAKKNIKVTTDAACAAVNIIHKKIKACKTNLDLIEKILDTAGKYGGQLEIVNKKQQLEEIAAKIQKFDQSVIDNQLAEFLKSAEDIQQQIEKNIAAGLIKKNQPLKELQVTPDQAENKKNSTPALKPSKGKNHKNSARSKKARKVAEAKEKQLARKIQAETEGTTNIPALETQIEKASLPTKPKKIGLNVEDLKLDVMDTQKSLVSSESQSLKELVTIKSATAIAATNPINELMELPKKSPEPLNDSVKRFFPYNKKITVGENAETVEEKKLTTDDKSAHKKASTPEKTAEMMLNILRFDDLKPINAKVQGFLSEKEIKLKTNSSLTSEGAGTVNRLLPAEFLSTDLIRAITPERQIALNKFFEVATGMAKLGISLEVGGTFSIECAADFLRKRSLAAADIDFICFVTDRVLITKIHQLMIQHKFKCIAGEKVFYRFIFDQEGTVIDITVMLPGYKKKQEPFLLMQQKMKVFKDDDGILHFQLDKAARGVLNFYINDGIFPVELFLTKERNNLWHFLARLAKYLIKCQDNLIIQFVIRENGQLNKIPYRYAQAYMRSLMYEAYVAKSHTHIKHHYSSIKKIINAGIFADTQCGSLIVTPMCEARLWFSLSHRSFDESDKEAINQLVINAARNMTIVLQQYFKEHREKAGSFSSFLDLLAEYNIAELANENNIASYVKTINSYVPPVSNRYAFKFTETTPLPSAPTPTATSQSSDGEFKIHGLN